MKYDLGFIGCGNMGGALALAAANCPGVRIALCDLYAPKAQALAEQIDATVLSAQEIAQLCRYVVLGVKPQMMRDLAAEIAPTLRAREVAPILVSMAAGIEMRDLLSMFGDYPLIRIMPNTPCAVGAGMITYCHTMAAAPHVPEYLRLMAGAGMFDMIDESKIDAASAVAGCGPAFACLFMEALADGGVQCGLTRAQALRYAQQMLLGTAQLALATHAHPGQMKDNVCSPGGSTIAGVAALEEGALRGTVMRAVREAYLRNQQLGK